MLAWIGVQAFGSLAAFGLVTRGYQFAAASTLSVFENSFLISASLWAFETPAPAGAVGIALIIASGVIAAGVSSTHPVARVPAAQDRG